jgi:hypothetical protein
MLQAQDTTKSEAGSHMSAIISINRWFTHFISRRAFPPAPPTPPPPLDLLAVSTTDLF